MNTYINGMYKILASLAILLITGCNNFLDEVQDNRSFISSKEKVVQLVTGAYANAQYAEFAESMSDNADDKGPKVDNRNLINEKAYKWEDFTAEVNYETTSNYWTESYGAIAVANHTLEAIEKLGGGSELDQYKGEALVARAYAHFMLVSIFSMRYDPTTAASELGVPYVTEPEKNAIKKYKRETIEETYRLIEKDLQEGLKLVGNEYEEAKFHFTKDASMAFATRFYLHKGDWKNVVKYANGMLQDDDPALLLKDFVSSSYLSLSYSERLSFQSSALETSNLLVSWVSSTYGRRFVTNRYALSDAQREVLFSSESNPFAKSWGYNPFGRAVTYNLPKYAEYFRITNVAQGTGYPYAAVVHFTTEEVLLNRAEAYAMMGNNTNALADMTAFLSKKTQRYDPSIDILTLKVLKRTFSNVAEYDPPYALTEAQEIFVKAIAEFKRREFYHEGYRWFDVKRFNIVVEHKIIGSGQIETIILNKDDPRRAVQIPKSAKTFGIKENRR